VRVVVFGATGMIGQGVLRECLLDADVTSVLVVGRSSTGQRSAKLRELTVTDFSDFSGVEGELAGLDACFFCLGVSSAGLSEEAYRRITYDTTLAAARTLLRANPELVFIYVSGVGTDSTERGRVMWARVKGRTENELLALTPRSYMLRPGFIQPLHGARSSTRLYRVLYAVLRPVFPVLRVTLRSSYTNTERIGRAMINIAKLGAPTRVLEPRDINTAAAATAPGTPDGRPTGTSA
jgi:uncharacterized protein YbjT (DUF2867 family)